MRDYSKVSGAFWTGKTGKALRGDFQAQVVAMYLMTSPHANMIGVFHCPLIYIAHETGSPIEGALKGLQRLCNEAFCTYDEESEMVWVHEMARFQVGDVLKPTDKQVLGIQKQYDSMPEGRIKSGFFEKYSEAFCIAGSKKKSKPLASPLQAPTKPEAGTGTETGVNRFAEFWSAYPKKKAKADALKAWKKAEVNGEFQSLLTALELQKQSADWKKNNGEFIPFPATWLNGRRWEDEIPVGDTAQASSLFAGVL